MEIDHLLYLAMHGAAAILSKRRHPEKSFEDMRNGIFSRQRDVTSYPIIVRAIAESQDCQITSAQSYWDSLSAKEKKQVREDKKIKIRELMIRARDLELEETTEPA